LQQLLDTENDAASLYNLFASTQNNLRHMIPEKNYQPSPSDVQRGIHLQAS